MKTSFKLVAICLLLVISSTLILAYDLKVGVALVHDSKSELLVGEDTYKSLIENAYNTLILAGIPVTTIESESVKEGDLQYFNGVVFVACSALDESFKAPLEDFVNGGGILAATYNTAMFTTDGKQVNNDWLQELLGISSQTLKETELSVLLETDEGTFSTSYPTTLVTPLEKTHTLAKFANNNEYAPFLKTDRTLYCSLNIFSNTKESDETFGFFFADELINLLGDEDLFLVSIPYEEIKSLASEARSLLRVSQKEYRDAKKREALPDYINELYEESLIMSKALQFAVENRSGYHLPRYTMRGNKIANELFNETNPTKISYSILKARGTYWADKVMKYSLETVPTNPIVFVGDSLTDRYDLAHYYPDLNVINRGIGGDFASGLWDRKHLFALDKEPTDLFIMIGTNNLLYNNQLSLYLEDVEKFLLFVKETSPKTRIYIQSICPMAAKTSVSPAAIQEKNQQLQALANKHGIKFIDLYSLFVGQDGYIKPELTVDGVHFTPAGYKIWTDTVNKLF